MENECVIGLDAGDNDTSDVDIPDADPVIEFNGCGGDEELVWDGAAAGPGQACGECGDGVLVCDGPEDLLCAGAGVQNACGGCGDLPGMEGDSCGACGEGVFQCTGQGSMTCEGATETNACGGCAPLVGEPDEPSGRASVSS